MQDHIAGAKTSISRCFCSWIMHLVMLNTRLICTLQVCFLPPNTASKIQPLDQEFIANVKLMYYQTIHNQMRWETDSQIELLQISTESDSEEDNVYAILGPSGSSILTVKQF